MKPMASALVNRLIHVQLKPSTREWLGWAAESDIHPLVIEYIQLRPDHLWSAPPKHEEPFSTPRAWHMLSDALKGFGSQISDEWLGVLAFGCLTPTHAGQFKAFVKQMRGRYQLNAILKGDVGWPTSPEDRDVLYFLAQAFRAQLLKELPPDASTNNESARQVAYRAKAALKDASKALAGKPADLARVEALAAELNIER